MRRKESGKKLTPVRRVRSGEKPQKSIGKPDILSLDILSGNALIKALRGSCKGSGSLVQAREREHKRDERASAQKRRARSEQTS